MSPHKILLTLILALIGFCSVLYGAESSLDSLFYDRIDHFPAGRQLNSNQSNPSLDEASFRDLVLEVVSSYRGLAEYHGAELKLRLPVGAPIASGCSQLDSEQQILHCSWESDFANADAGRNLKDKTWYIGIGGGLMHLQGMTDEGLTLVTCHEIGHLFGGFPFVHEGFTGLSLPLSAEGQADYFASQVCLRRIWQNRDNSQSRSGLIYRDHIEKGAVSRCDLAYQDKPSRDLCYKSIYAGMSFVLALVDPYEPPMNPSIETPDTTVADSTLGTHPPSQCRFDSFIAAALCPTILSGSPSPQWSQDPESVWVTETVIPGYLQSQPGGIDARAESLAVTCRDNFFPQGARPLCWFNPDEISAGGWIDEL